MQDCGDLHCEVSNIIAGFNLARDCVMKSKPSPCVCVCLCDTFLAAVFSGMCDASQVVEVFWLAAVSVFKAGVVQSCARMVVAELLRWRCPMSLVLLLVLMSFNPLLDQREDWYVYMYVHIGRYRGHRWRGRYGYVWYRYVYVHVSMHTSTYVWNSVYVYSGQRLRRGVCW